MASKKHKGRGPGFLYFWALMFAVVGVLAIAKPTSMVSVGGVGWMAQTPVDSYFTARASPGFGVVFLGISLFLFLVARRVGKGP